MNPEEYYRRITQLIAPERLQARKVVVVGLGSGGCRVAAELGRLGIDLVLVDRPGERLEEHNIVRHLLGYASLGKNKVQEMSRYLRRLHPSSQVTRCSLDVARQPRALARRLERWRPDLLAVCTDNEQSKHALNEAAIGLGIPQVGAGVYDGGVGGEVYRVRPGGPCYGCIAAQLRLERFTPEQAPAPDYTRPEPFAVQSTCALNLDIEQIALLQTRVILAELLAQPELAGMPPNANLLVFANRAVPGIFPRPLHCDFYEVTKQPGCLACGRTNGDVEQRAQQILSALRLDPAPAPAARR